MSYTFTLSARKSIISNKIYPPIILEENATYVLGLIDLMTYNTIPNIDESNNKFFIGNYELELPEGAYEIVDIEKTLNALLTEKEEKQKVISYEVGGGTSTHPLPFAHIRPDTPIVTTTKRRKNTEKAVFYIKQNLNTLKCEIKSNLEVNFDKPNTIASILGFKSRKLAAFKKHYSDYHANITKVNSICIQCNLIQNSFNNDVPVHIIHMFYPNVPPGWKIVEKPATVIYLPINTKFINEIILTITDQDGNLINFKEELVTVRLHLKRIA